MGVSASYTSIISPSGADGNCQHLKGDKAEGYLGSVKSQLWDQSAH